MKKAKLVLNCILMATMLIAMFVLGCIGIDGGNRAALVGAFVLGGISIADAVFYLDRVGC